VTLGIAHGHNMAAAGTVTAYGKTTANPWVTPGTTQILVGDDLSNKRLLFFGTQSFPLLGARHRRRPEHAGYSELGVPFIGTYWEPGRGYRSGRRGRVSH